MYERQSPQGGEKLRWVAQPLTKLPRARICGLRFRRWRIPSNGDYGCADGQKEKHFPLNALGTFWQLLEQSYRRTETTYRISIGRALKRLLAGTPQVFDRLAEVIAATIVTRQVAQVIIQSLGVHQLQGCSGTLVQ